MVRNSPDYDSALARRGDITVWISKAAIKALRPAAGHNGYADLAIETALTIRKVFSLALRQTEGFLCSILTMMGLGLPVPDHTTLSRRRRHLAMNRYVDVGSGGQDIVVDSTGLRLFRSTKSRGLCCKTVKRRQGLLTPRGIIPPRGPVIRPFATLDPWSQCGKHNAFVAKHGRREWQMTFSYGRRNLVEAAFSRYKRVMDDNLRGRGLLAQQAEAKIAIQALNKMTELGMPVTARVM